MTWVIGAEQIVCYIYVLICRFLFIFKKPPKKEGKKERKETLYLELSNRWNDLT